MRFLFVLFTLFIVTLGALQFSGITHLEDPNLIREVQSQLLMNHRSQSAEQFNDSLKNESLGKIFTRAADLLTTQVTLVSTRMSQPLIKLGDRTTAIIEAQYLVENSSEEPLEEQRYLKFTKEGESPWHFINDSSATEFYLNFIIINFPDRLGQE